MTGENYAPSMNSLFINCVCVRDVARCRSLTNARYSRKHVRTRQTNQIGEKNGMSKIAVIVTDGQWVGCGGSAQCSLFGTTSERTGWRRRVRHRRLLVLLTHFRILSIEFNGIVLDVGRRRIAD